MALTDVKIRKAKAKAKQYKIYDERGLYVLIMKNGRKYFRLDYRFMKKRKTLALGIYPAVSLSEARQGRDKAKELLDRGIDPSQHKQEQAALNRELSANTFKDVALEWLSKKRPEWVPAHSDRVASRLVRDVFPYLGKRPIKLITSVELLEVLRRIERRGAINTSHRVKQTCGQIFRFAIATGRADRDPSADLKGALISVKTKNMAAITDPVKIGGLLRAIDGYDGQFVTRCALQLAPLLFVRPGELRHAEWPEIDLDGALWKIPAFKMKMRLPHLVPLADQAVSILREIYPVTGRGRYVFPSIRTGTRPMSENTINGALRRMGYAKAEMTGHGFRGMASTLLHEQGWPTDVIERQLAHTEGNSVKAAYNHAEHLPERSRMMQAWADYLDVLKRGNVIPFRRANGSQKL